MRVALITRDKPNALQTRLDNRGKMTGSLIIMNVDTLTDAQNWADNDPYAKAGLFEKVRIEEWKKVIG